MPRWRNKFGLESRGPNANDGPVEDGRPQGAGDRQDELREAFGREEQPARREGGLARRLGLRRHPAPRPEDEGVRPNAGRRDGPAFVDPQRAAEQRAAQPGAPDADIAGLHWAGLLPEGVDFGNDEPRVERAHPRGPRAPLDRFQPPRNEGLPLQIQRGVEDLALRPQREANLPRQQVAPVIRDVDAAFQAPVDFGLPPEVRQGGDPFWAPPDAGLPPGDWAPPSVDRYVATPEARGEQRGQGDGAEERAPGLVRQNAEYGPVRHGAIKRTPSERERTREAAARRVGARRQQRQEAPEGWVPYRQHEAGRDEARNRAAELEAAYRRANAPEPQREVVRDRPPLERRPHVARRAEPPVPAVEPKPDELVENRNRAADLENAWRQANPRPLPEPRREVVRAPPLAGPPRLPEPARRPEVAPVSGRPAVPPPAFLQPAVDPKEANVRSLAAEIRDLKPQKITEDEALRLARRIVYPSGKELDKQERFTIERFSNGEVGLRMEDKLGEGGFKAAKDAARLSRDPKGNIHAGSAARVVMHTANDRTRQEMARDETRRFIEFNDLPRMVKTYAVKEKVVGGDLKKTTALQDKYDGDLVDLLSKGPRLSPEDQTRLVLDVLAGPRALHKQGYVHLDIKPDNFLFRTEGGRIRASLSDFGLVVREFAESDGRTRDYLPLDTHRRINEEARRGKKPQRTSHDDRYALGLVSYLIAKQGQWLPNNYKTQGLPAARDGTILKVAQELAAVDQTQRPVLDAAVHRVIDAEMRRYAGTNPRFQQALASYEGKYGPIRLVENERLPRPSAWDPNSRTIHLKPGAFDGSWSIDKITSRIGFEMLNAGLDDKYAKVWDDAKRSQRTPFAATSFASTMEYLEHGRMEAHHKVFEGDRGKDLYAPMLARYPDAMSYAQRAWESRGDKPSHQAMYERAFFQAQGDPNAPRPYVLLPTRPKGEGEEVLPVPRPEDAMVLDEARGDPRVVDGSKQEAFPRTEGGLVDVRTARGGPKNGPSTLTAPTADVDQLLVPAGRVNRIGPEQELTSQGGYAVRGLTGGDEPGRAQWGASARYGTVSNEGQHSGAAVAKATADGNLDARINGHKIGAIGGDVGISGAARGSIFHDARDAKNLNLGIQSELGAKAYAGATVQVGNDQFHLKNRGAVGAGADATFTGQVLTKDGVPGINLAAGVDAGASITGESTLKAGPAEGWVKGGVIAGFAAGAGVQLGMQSDGKFHIGAGFKLALGAGIQLGFDISIDPKPIKEFFTKTLPDKVFKPVKNAFEKVGKGFKDAGEKIKDGFKKAGEKIKDGFKKAGEKIKDGFKKVGEGIKNFFSGW